MSRRGGGGTAGRHRRVLAELAVGVALPGPVAGGGAPLSADAEAADLRSRPAPSWPRRRPACPSRSAGSATGTTATSGSATRPSASTRCCGWASPARPTPSCSSCQARHREPSSAPPARCRSCTASTGAPSCPSANCATWRATGARRRCGSGTPRPSSSSSTSTARSSTRSTSTTSWHQPISSAHWDTITTRADWVCDHWDQPDEGIWETRGGPQEVPVLAAHVLGGDRTGDPAGHPPGPARRPGPLAEGPRCDLPADHGPRLVTKADRRSPSTKAATSSTRPSC